MGRKLSVCLSFSNQCSLFPHHFTLQIWSNATFPNKHLSFLIQKMKFFPYQKIHWNRLSICIYNTQSLWKGMLGTFLKYYPYHKYSFGMLCFKTEKRYCLKVLWSNKCKNKSWDFLCVYGLIFSLTSLKKTDHCSSQALEVYGFYTVQTQSS